MLNYFNNYNAAAPEPVFDFFEQVENVRSQAISSLDDPQKKILGQFFTPLSIARIMAQMVKCKCGNLTVLDAGAGAGVLTAMLVASACQKSSGVNNIEVTAIEIDEKLIPFLRRMMELCRRKCEIHEIEFSAEIHNENFLNFASHRLSAGLFSGQSADKFDVAVINPPYAKVKKSSSENHLLRRLGIVAPNIYAAFLALCAELLTTDGELIAITPRSFCNGVYYKPFRRYFLERMSFQHFHIFGSRRAIFDEDILQENIVFHAVKNKSITGHIVISKSENVVENAVDFIELKDEEVIKPGDEEFFIHLDETNGNSNNFYFIEKFQCSLDDLNLKVSTGKVVDFRAKESLQNGAGKDSIPLIYPHNIRKGTVEYPVVHHKKFNAIRDNVLTGILLIENETYVLVKRFSAKEEKKRITAALYEPKNSPAKKVGFENHLNYFHADGRGISSLLARGLTLYLNSSLIDEYFRRFSGHTQVNATDLRYLKYPSRNELEKIGAHFDMAVHSQEKIDILISEL